LVEVARHEYPQDVDRAFAADRQRGFAGEDVPRAPG
jgi:hypothetical protein